MNLYIHDIKEGPSLKFCASIFCGRQVRWRKANLWRDCWTWSCWSLVRPKKDMWSLKRVVFLLRKVPFSNHETIYAKLWMFNLQGTNISHLGKRKIIFKMPFWGDMLVPRRVYFAYFLGCGVYGFLFRGAWVPLGVPAQLIYFCNLFCVKLLFRKRWIANDKFS